MRTARPEVGRRSVSVRFFLSGLGLGAYVPYSNTYYNAGSRAAAADGERKTELIGTPGAKQWSVL